MVCPTEKAVYDLAFLTGVKSDEILIPCVELLAPLYPPCTDGSAHFTLQLATKWEAGGQPDEEGKLQG